jgi:hypothetical protein
MNIRTVIGSVASLLLVVSSSLLAQATVRVGTFDSRAIAIAYGRSQAFAADLTQLRTDHQKAKEEKNEKLVSELALKGQMQQKLMHLQGFSIGSVAEILAKYPDLVAATAKEANVVMVVSIFELAYQGPGVEIVDVTEALATRINSDPRITAMLGEIKKVKPLPMLDVLLLKDEH